MQAGRDCELLQADVEGAYLNGRIGKAIYMEIPERLTANNGYVVFGSTRRYTASDNRGRQWRLELGSKLELLG